MFSEVHQISRPNFFRSYMLRSWNNSTVFIQVSHPPPPPDTLHLTKNKNTNLPIKTHGIIYHFIRHPYLVITSTCTCELLYAKYYFCLTYEDSSTMDS